MRTKIYIHVSGKLIRSIGVFYSPCFCMFFYGPTARIAHCPLQAHVGAGGEVAVADACSSSSGRDKVTVSAANVSLSANASASKSVPFSIDRKKGLGGGGWR